METKTDSILSTIQYNMDLCSCPLTHKPSQRPLYALTNSSLLSLLLYASGDKDVSLTVCGSGFHVAGREQKEGLDATEFCNYRPVSIPIETPTKGCFEQIAATLGQNRWHPEAPVGVLQRSQHRDGTAQ